MGSIHGRGSDIFSGHRVRTCSVAHSAPYPMGTGGSFLEGKTGGAWNWPLTSI
jgi:hypothetical protein